MTIPKVIKTDGPPMKMEPKLSTKPKKRPPIIAPGKLPNPPRTTTIKVFRRAVVPAVASTKYMGAISIPANPAVAEAMKKVIA